jgi:MFS family permease
LTPSGCPRRSDRRTWPTNDASGWPARWSPWRIRPIRRSGSWRRRSPRSHSARTGSSTENIASTTTITLLLFIIGGGPGDLFGRRRILLLSTLLIGVGERDFAYRLRDLGLSPEQIEQARAALALALQSDAAFDPSGLPPVLQAALGGYRDSYAVAFGQVLLVAAARMGLGTGRDLPRS